MDFPLVSVVIATFNSEKILPKTLEAIRNQSYDQDKIEILMIDGGSTDNTVALADEYSCLVYPNPKTDPVSATEKLGRWGLVNYPVFEQSL